MGVSIKWSLFSYHINPLGGAHLCSPLSEISIHCKTTWTVCLLTGFCWYSVHDISCPFWFTKRWITCLRNILSLLSSAAGSNPRWPWLPTNTNCHIPLMGICSFWTYMLELTSVVSEVTVAETRSFLETAKDNTHGAAVVTVLQDSRGDKNINITNSHRRLRLSSTAMCEVLRTRTSLDWSFTVAGPHLCHNPYLSTYVIVNLLSWSLPRYWRCSCYYLLCKSYQGTRKIMQKTQKREIKNIQKKHLTQWKYSSQSFVHLI